MRQNGLLMEVKGKKAVVLGKDGRFYTTAVQAGWEIGQEITWDPNLRRKSYRVPIWQKTLAAGAAACLILGGGLWYAVQHSTLTRAYAYVSVDINPSILYTLNHQEKVIGAKGLNADGKTLLTHLHPKGEGLQKVLSETVKTAVLNHMLPKKDTILVTAAPIHSNEDVSTLMSMARADMEQAVTMNPQAVKQDPGVYSLPVSAAVSQAAQKLKVSPGKLIAYLAAHQAGQNVQMQQLHGQVLKDILTNAQLPTVLSTIQADNVHQIEDWVSKAMSVKDQPAAVQKSNNQNHSKDNGQNVVSSSTAPSPAKVPSHSSQSHVPTAHSSQRGSNSRGHSPNGNGKHLAKGHNAGNNGKHYGQTKHPQSGSSVKSSLNGIFSMGQRGQGNQIRSAFQSVINKIESMGGQPKVPESSSNDANRSTSYPSYSNGNQTQSDGSSPADNQTSSSGDSRSLNTVQNDTFNGSNTGNQSNNGTGDGTVNGSSNSSGNSPSDQTDSSGDN